MKERAVMADTRPSFREFWKKSKEALGATKVRFVESNTGQGAASSEGSQDAESATKAQIRRAQVRKAQAEHRQRKANYVKQLEIDVARIREMIAAAQHETHVLLAERMVMRGQLQHAVTQMSSPLSMDQRLFLLNRIPQPPQLSCEIQSDLQQELEPVTVTLGYDEIMNAPSFYISSPPTTNPAYPSPPPQSSPDPDDLPNMTPAQTQQAINFILALEHICRDHFNPSLFNPPADAVAPVPLIGHQANGHTLMATSLALRTAPPRIFKAASRTRLFRGSSISLRPPQPRRRARPDQQPPLRNSNSNPDHGHHADPDSSPDGDEEDEDEDEDDALSWRATALTLRSLHGLARSLHPAAADGVELTPVQAWFELAARFGVEALASAVTTTAATTTYCGAGEAVLDRLKRELLGVVRCLHFGASMERGAFESVVGRVLGEGGGTPAGLLG